MRHFKTVAFICNSKHLWINWNKLTPGELTRLRGVSGSANWLANQTRPDLCVSTSLLQSAQASATVADIREANKLIRLCRQHAHVPIRVSPVPLDDLTFVGFGDCGWCVRRYGSSQGGSLIIAVHKRILDGFEATTTIVDWKSYKCNVLCAVPLLVRLRPTWKHLTR